MFRAPLQVTKHDTATITTERLLQGIERPDAVFVACVGLSGESATATLDCQLAREAAFPLKFEIAPR